VIARVVSKSTLATGVGIPVVLIGLMPGADGYMVTGGM
jgi:hypothetical protein